MIRFNSPLIRKLLLVKNGRQQTLRFFSARVSMKYKAYLLLSTGAVAISAMSLAYAKYDKQFADRLIGYAPFVKNLLDDTEKKRPDDDLFFPKKNPESKKSIPEVTTRPSKPNEKVEAKLSNETKEKPIEMKPSNQIALSSPQSAPIETDEKKEEKSEAKKEKSLQESLNIDLEQTDNKLENEFRGQLKRLLHAFNEFYEEKRILYETENKRNQEIELKNQLIRERAEITDSYEKSFKKLKQIENLLQTLFFQVRDQLDKQEKASKKLWLVSQSISKLMEHNRTLKMEAKPIEINEKIAVVRKIIDENFSNEPLLKAAINSLSEESLRNGVYSEEDLIRRFKNVHKVCNRVALVAEEYTNIFGYINSYLYSFIRPLFQIEYNLSSNPMRMKTISQDEIEGKIEIDPNQWDAFDVLERVSLCIENRNFEMALRYASLLKGEPKKVASDWIKDTRRHLEVKQALDLIQTKIASINLHQYSFSL
ncbi:MICOS complex subunit Mic60 [Sarcoptes scabiei]|nr:MICOS complex subunit Mic60 [Sarcoptes scabiei]